MVKNLLTKQETQQTWVQSLEEEITTHSSILGLDGKAFDYSVGRQGSIPGSGRSPGEGNDNQLQYSCLENPMDGETWQATVHRVAELDMTE